ncbi:MAG: DNA polymerase III subunit delta [bacterium]
MLIFLYGQDNYSSHKKLNEIIGHYKKTHKSGLSLKCFDGKNLDFDSFKDEFQQTSMFEEKKLTVLKNIFSNQGFKEKFLKESKKILGSDDITLVYEEGKVLKSDKLFAFLKKNSKAQEFAPLKDLKLKNWLKKEFAGYGAEIGSEALNKLIDFAGSDLWRLDNEVKKLVSFKFGKKIEIKDIDLLVRPKIETDIFKTIDAIALKNRKRALSLLHEHLEKGDSPLYLLSMINFQFRNLLIVKDFIERKIPYYAILKTSRLHPFIVRKSYEQAGRFTLTELKKIYQNIFQIDISIKTGKTEPKAALDLFIAGI